MNSLTEKKASSAVCNPFWIQLLFIHIKGIRQKEAEKKKNLEKTTEIHVLTNCQQIIFKPTKSRS